MSRFVKWLINSARTILENFFGQIISAFIFFAAFVAWGYFSSGYAAVLVLILGLVLWLIIGNLLDRRKNKQARTNIK